LQKLLSALVAIISFSTFLCGMRATPSIAQEHPSTGSGQETATPEAGKPMVLPPGVTNENVDVKDRPLIIEGDVKGSVHAVNSKVTLMPGATVEGNLTLEGGTLSVAPSTTGMIASIAAERTRTSHAARNSKRGDWFGGQFCLWLLGLGGGVIILLAAPGAMSRVTNTVSLQPGQSLVAGLITAAVMAAALAVSGLIMKTFLSVIWMPILIVIALVSLVVLVFGWLAGMRRVGDLLARRFGQTGGGTFYGRMTLGLSAFFLANAVLGVIVPALGAVGLFLEFGIALMGVGAIVRTGFGKDEPFLDGRFHRTSGSGIG